MTVVAAADIGAQGMISELHDKLFRHGFLASGTSLGYNWVASCHELTR